MNKSGNTVLRAKFTYYFKETFRAHSRAEYREIFSRGLNDDNGGITGTQPWLYVRAFFGLFILFTINVLVLRLTNNSLYIPSVVFLGGVTFTIPFVILLYELYPKRDLSLFMLIGVLVAGGTAAGVLSQLFYEFFPAENKWLVAVRAGLVEELCKLVPAMLAVVFIRNKNPYACFLIAATVGAGFSVVEDMGYIFYYSEKYAFNYRSDIQAIVALFVDRGMSSFCTHILWTGAVGWAYGIAKRPFRSVGLAVLAVSIVLHICWDLPLTGFLQALDIILCVVVAAAINIAIVHKTRINILADEVGLTRANEVIISEAKSLGEKLRFTNAANFTFALTCALMSVIVLLLCALPIGMEYQSVEYADRTQFLTFVEGGYNLKKDTDRKYDPLAYNVEERFIDGELTYVVQKVDESGFDGVYYYGYYLSDKTAPDYIAVELEDYTSRITCVEYKFGEESEWAFEVNAELLKEYSYHKDGTVTAVTAAEEFGGYNLLIGLCATGFALAAGCTVIIIALRIKLWRVKDD